MAAWVCGPHGSSGFAYKGWSAAGPGQTNAVDSVAFYDEPFEVPAVKGSWGTYLALGVLAFASGQWIAPVFLAAKSADTRLLLVSNAVAWVGLLFFFVLAAHGWKYERHKQSLLVRLRDISALRDMHWSELEEVVTGMYERLGYSAQRIGGQGPDGGIDVVLRKGGNKTFVQCKQWRARSVSVGVVRELLGSMTAEKAGAGVVITCGSFTGSAWKFASDNGIELIDGMRLVEKVGPVRRALVASGGFNQDEHSDGGAARDCPVCRGLMVRRMRSPMRGGGGFWGCSRYPVCKGTRQD